jgi:hypothetical protein
VSEWDDISSAPRDGTAIYAKRVHRGVVIWEGLAEWRTVTFPSFINGRHGVEPEYTATGWMYPRIDKRVPEPTHWRAE